MATDDRSLGGHIIGEALDVSSGRFLYTTFTDCRVTRGSNAEKMVGCFFLDCTFIGEGWPEHLLSAPPLRVEVSDLGEGALASHEFPPRA